MTTVIEWITLFKEQILRTSLLEYLAVGFGVSEVFLAKRNNIWLYPTGIISILLGMYLLLDANLYAEVLLSMYYLIMSVYGWVIWRKRVGNKQMLEVSWTSRNELYTALGISIVGYFILYFALVNFTNSDVPVFDAFISSTAWAGMWLLTRRKIENWVFLNISNFVAIPLLIHKDLAMMAVLTFILFIVAVFGYFDWKKIYQRRVSSSSKVKEFTP